MLLADAVRRAVSAADVDGSRLLVANPHTDLGAGFLEHHGFRRLPGGGPMFQSVARLSRHLGVA